MTNKKIKQAEWTATHTLTNEQVKQLICKKFERAMQQHRAVKQRETAHGQLRIAKCE
jgi:hypothetical protein